MSVIGEVVAVAAMVAALVSAYKDGSSIVHRLKEKRRAAKALPPSVHLEQSLARGPIVVEDAANAGLERFGSAFAKGDEIALNSLRDIIIELQGGIIRELGKALEDDNITDFSVVVQASDSGRMKAVVTLNELYLRMAAQTAMPISTTYRSLQYAPGPIAQSQGIQVVQPHTQGNGDRSLTGIHTTHDADTIVATNAISPGKLSRDQNTQPRSKRGSIGDKLQRMFSNPTPRQPSQTKIDHNDSQHLRSPVASPVARENTTTPWQTGITSQEQALLTHDPWRDEPRPSSRPSISSSLSGNSLAAKAAKRQATIPNSGPIQQDAKFGGFCKGAYHLQVGLKKEGVKLRNASQSFQGEGYYFACSSSKCCFQMPACKQGKEWVFDDAVRQSYDVEFRWSFLAKSHVAVSKVKGSSYHYRCIFCVQQGRDAPVLVGISGLIKHVATHTGEVLGVGDKILMGDDDFDIRFPETAMEPEQAESLHSERRTSEELFWSADEDSNPTIDHWRDA